MNNSAWQQARRDAGLRSVRVHDLRHTYACRLRAAGVSAEDRAALLGHATQSVVGHYASADVGRLLRESSGRPSTLSGLSTALESRRYVATLQFAQGPSMLDVALDTTDQHDAFRQALTDHGIRCALELLNDRTSYRFTAIYKLVGSVLRAQYAYDRACEYRTWLMVVPLERSFCQYAIESGEFMTSCVSKDPRLANRPYAGMVEAYYGQLLVRPDGTPYGTFIHFDLESRSIAADEIEFLRETVPLFMKQLA